MKEQIENLVNDLQKLKSAHNLATISARIDDLTLEQLQEVCNKLKLDVEFGSGYFHTRYEAETSIVISFFSVKQELKNRPKPRIILSDYIQNPAA